MLRVEIDQGRLRIGERFSVSFQRTLRIPDDGHVYPLPPGLGPFSIHAARDYADRVPPSWVGAGEHVFIALYQREALWLGFGGVSWKPNAVKIAAGTINAVTGGPWEDALQAHLQDYLVCPNQPWLDGFNAGAALVRQFVAMPLGEGYSLEAQLTGAEQVGGIQMRVYEPKPGRFPDHPPPEPEPTAPMPVGMAASLPEMGLGAGGRMRQKIYPDPYGWDTWDQEHAVSVNIHLLNSRQYQEVTGEALPPTAIDAQTYVEHGLPWFELYDEPSGDVPASGRLSAIKSVQELDAARGAASEGAGEGEKSQSTQRDRLRIELLRMKRPLRPPEESK